MLVLFSGGVGFHPPGTPQDSPKTLPKHLQPQFLRVKEVKTAYYFKWFFKLSVQNICYIFESGHSKPCQFNLPSASIPLRLLSQLDTEWGRWTAQSVPPPHQRWCEACWTAKIRRSGQWSNYPVQQSNWAWSPVRESSSPAIPLPSSPGPHTLLGRTQEGASSLLITFFFQFVFLSRRLLFLFDFSCGKLQKSQQSIFWASQKPSKTI